MNNKDKKFIVGCLVIAFIAGFIYFILEMNHQGDKGIVEYQEKILFEFSLNKDDIYEFEGSYGTMHLEVKDGRYRVVDVDCPNHNCEQMGWHDKDSYTPIVCLPNEVIIYTESE